MSVIFLLLFRSSFRLWKWFPIFEQSRWTSFPTKMSRSRLIFCGEDGRKERTLKFRFLRNSPNPLRHRSHKSKVQRWDIQSCSLLVSLNWLKNQSRRWVTMNIQFPSIIKSHAKKTGWKSIPQSFFCTRPALEKSESGRSMKLYVCQPLCANVKEDDCTRTLEKYDCKRRNVLLWRSNVSCAMLRKIRWIGTNLLLIYSEYS